MKPTYSKFAKFLSIAVLLGLLVGGFALAFPAVAQAQGSNPPAQPTPTDKQAAQVARLEKAYQAELKALDAQAKRLDTADARVQKVTDRIASLKSQGKDTTAIDQELSDFKDMLKTAHSSHDSAASILKTHAGFDANGKVTDPKLAQDTVQQARKLLRDVPQTLRPAVRDLVRTIRQFLRDNRKK